VRESVVSGMRDFRNRVRVAGALLMCGLVAGVVPLAGASVAAADASSLIISEVWPGGSGNGTYAADWFEVTNTGATPVDITGWKVDDSSNAYASSVPLAGVTSIGAGQSVVFVEGGAATATAFVTAWFGASPPAGFAIGTYSGGGIGLSGSGDAVNLFDGSGTPVTGVTFGAAGTATTFDNAAGLGAVSTLSVVGTNGASVSSNGAETGSPGTIAGAPASAGVDLSTYVRVGRYDLPEPTRTTPPDGTSLLAQETSAVTYNPVTDTLFVVGDGGTSIVQVSKTGALVDSMTLAPGSSPQGTEFYDPEGLTYIGGGNQFALVEERDRQVSRFTYAAGTTLARADVQTVDLGTFVDNTGIEGITFDPFTGGFVAVKEVSPEGVFQTGIDFDAGTATNGSSSTVDSTNLFDPALTGLSDFADVYALSNLPSMSGQPQEPDLLVLSQEDGRIVNIDRSGTVSSSLTIVSDPGNPLSVPNQQHEGLTMDHDGNLYVVNENGGGSIDHPQLWVYAPSAAPNQAPTAVELTNQVAAIAENTSTATRLKVADVVVTDDGLGTNDLTVTGPDAASFEVDSNGLYIKAGTVLDHETTTSYTVSVEVDDPAAGEAPDVTSAPFVLTVTDLADESTSLPALVISEVSPWSSGGSPYLADWFEVTNNGGTAVDLTGYRMDDNSNVFASSVALAGVAAIAPGQSVVFVEGDAARAAALQTAWFGATVPAGFAIGTYSGGGVGLSTGGDSVNLFDGGGQRVTGVSFGVSTTGQTFDNTAGAGSTDLPLPLVSTLSAVGVNAAFLAADSLETGSPGTKATTLILSEVSPWSSGSSPYAADWFEITNIGAGPVDITGWKVDDNSNSPVGAVALKGVTSIAAGRSVVFLEGDAGTAAAFLAAWFGSTPPVTLIVGTYSGSGVGLSTSSDAVNLFDASGRRITGVSFGAATTGSTFDNAAGVAGPISALSTVGANGAFVADDGIETGSPGRIVTVVPPSVLPGSAAVPEGNAGTSPLEVPVTLSAPSDRAVTVSWNTAVATGAPAGQADPSNDYEAGSGSVTFAPGETAKTVTVVVKGDTAVEMSEYIVIAFHHPTNATMGGFWGLGFGGVANDDNAILPGTASVHEGASGSTLLEVPVTLSTVSSQPVTVQWNTVVVASAPAGQADAATDYVPVSGTVTFDSGETATTVTVPVNGDTAPEADEYVVVSFHDATNGYVGGFYGLGLGHIVNDD
jgi:uncharacterized protein YjiK